MTIEEIYAEMSKNSDKTSVDLLTEFSSWFEKIQEEARQDVEVGKFLAQSVQLTEFGFMKKIENDPIWLVLGMQSIAADRNPYQLCMCLGVMTALKFLADKNQAEKLADMFQKS